MAANQVIWYQPGSATVHRNRTCAPAGSICIEAGIRLSECTGDYAVINEPPWTVLGDLCDCPDPTDYDSAS